VTGWAWSRRRRTLHPAQRALPIPELAEAGAIYGYSFILTNLDVPAPDKAAAAEHWYRHRTTVALATASGPRRDLQKPRAAANVDGLGGPLPL
jgi:hypothetical protein